MVRPVTPQAHPSAGGANDGTADTAYAAGDDNRNLDELVSDEVWESAIVNLVGHTGVLTQFWRRRSLNSWWGGAWACRGLRQHAFTPVMFLFFGFRCVVSPWPESRWFVPKLPVASLLLCHFQSASPIHSSWSVVHFASVSFRALQWHCGCSCADHLTPVQPMSEASDVETPNGVMDTGHQIQLHYTNPLALHHEAIYFASWLWHVARMHLTRLSRPSVGPALVVSPAKRRLGLGRFDCVSVYVTQLSAVISFDF